MNNTAVIVKVNSIHKHPNADTLQIVSLFGTQVITGMETKEGDIMIYFDSNLKLLPEYLRENNLYRHSELNKDRTQKGYFDDNGRVKAIKLRGEFSDGVLMPLSSIDFVGIKGSYDVGYEFNSIGDTLICEKYVLNKHIPGDKSPSGKSSIDIPMFKEHFDTGQYFKESYSIPKDTICYIEEKIHGTSGRAGMIEMDILSELTWYEKLIVKLYNKFASPRTRIDNISMWIYIHGSRRVNYLPGKISNSYHDNTMRDEIFNSINGSLIKGEEIYFEIFGHEKTGKEIQAGFKYGCAEKEYKAMLYRVSMNNEDGQSVDYSREYVYRRAEELGMMKPVLLEKVYFDGDLGKLDQIVIKHAQGQSTLDVNTLREGVVVWFIDSNGRWKALKYKSDAFRGLESSNKDKGITDIEDIV